MFRPTLLVCLFFLSTTAAFSNSTDPTTVCSGDGDCICPADSICTCQNAGDCMCGDSQMCLCQNGGNCYCGNTPDCKLENQGWGFCSGEIKTDDGACYAMHKPMTPQSVMCVPDAYNVSTLPANWEARGYKGRLIMECPPSEYAAIVTAITVPLACCMYLSVFGTALGKLVYRGVLRRRLTAEYKARVDQDYSDPKRGGGMMRLVYYNRANASCDWLKTSKYLLLIAVVTGVCVSITVYVYNHNRWTQPFFFFPSFMPVVFATYVGVKAAYSGGTGVFYGKTYPIPLVLKLDPKRGELTVAESFDDPRDQIRFVEPLANITEAIVARPFHVAAKQAEKESVLCVYLVRKSGAPWFTSPCLTFFDAITAATACNDINNFLASYHRKPVTSDPQTTESLGTHRDRRAARAPFVAPRWHEYFLPAIIEAPLEKGYASSEKGEKWTKRGATRDKEYGTLLPLKQMV